MSDNTITETVRSSVEYILNVELWISDTMSKVNKFVRQGDVWMKIAAGCLAFGWGCLLMGDGYDPWEYKRDQSGNLILKIDWKNFRTVGVGFILVGLVSTVFAFYLLSRSTKTQTTENRHLKSLPQQTSRVQSSQ